MKSYFTLVVANDESKMQIGFRMTLASLAGGAHFADLIYRRSQRRNLRAVIAAHDEARAAGDIVGERISIGDTSMFIEHVGAMLSAMRVIDTASSPYSHDGERLVREAVWFCCRGIGMTEAAIARHIDD